MKGHSQLKVMLDALRVEDKAKTLNVESHVQWALRAHRAANFDGYENELDAVRSLISTPTPLTTLWLGVMNCMRYEYSIVAATREEAEAKLLAEWKRQVKDAGTDGDFDVPFDQIDFKYIHEWNGSFVKAVTLGEVSMLQ